MAHVQALASHTIYYGYDISTAEMLHALFSSRIPNMQFNWQKYKRYIHLSDVLK